MTPYSGTQKEFFPYVIRIKSCYESGPGVAANERMEKAVLWLQTPFDLGVEKLRFEGYFEY